MSKSIHLQLDIRGALLNWNPSEWIGVATSEDGRKMSPREVQAELLDRLAAGEKYMPYGEPCEGWSPLTGCPGHETSDTEE